MYAPEKEFTVYCTACYQSDKWDPLSYGRSYDFSKPFFAQFAELMRIVPRHALYQDFAEGSEYSNWAVYLKNSYLIFGGHHYEDTAYAAQSFFLRDCADVDFCKKSEQCYGSIHLRQCNSVRFSSFSEDCADSWFLYGCRNCHHCVGCTNLRNASYCIFNERYTKEEYERKVAALALDTYAGAEAVRAEAARRSLAYPRKYAWVRNAVHSSGDDLDQVKNCRDCFSVSESENCRYSFFIPGDAKDAYDLDHCGLGIELTYELMSGFGNSRVRFGNRIYYCHDVTYSDDCHHSANLIGCAGLRKKDYCILNRQYTREEYEALAPKIIAHMNEVPYAQEMRNENGEMRKIEYRYGEFFPPSLAPFAYNETVAQEYFPTDKESAKASGFGWRKPDERHYAATVSPENLPLRANDAPDGITAQIITCETGSDASRGRSPDPQASGCTTAFRIIPAELQLLKKLGVSLPRRCPNCRHYERLARRNPLRLWHRACDCNRKPSVVGRESQYVNTAPHAHGAERCPNEFETSYAPERPEIIYCESCYQHEVS